MLEFGISHLLNKKDRLIPTFFISYKIGNGYCLITFIMSSFNIHKVWFSFVLSDRLFVSNLDKINCRENKKKKAGTYDLHKLKFRIA